MTQERPIGYWVKLVDRLVEAGVDAELVREGLKQRHWVVLNVVAERGPVDEAGVARMLTPFEQASVEPVGSTELTLLASRRWIRRETDGYVLTDDGVQHLAALRERVVALRERATAGIPARDVATTFAVLEQVAMNLGWSPEVDAWGNEV